MLRALMENSGQLTRTDDYCKQTEGNAKKIKRKC